MRRLTIASAFLALAGCAADVNHVTFTVPAEGATGLMCVDAAGNALALRAGTASLVRVTIVVDYVSFEGVASARPAVLIRHCVEHGCPVLLRECLDDIEFSIPPGATSAEVQQLALEQLRARGVLTHDAPDGVVVIRAVLSTQRCGDLTPVVDGRPPPFVTPALVGCLTSAPLQLDDVRGAVELELDVPLGFCTELEVCWCANLGLDIVGLCGLPT